MATYSIEEAKALLSELIDKALAGEGVTIMRDGKPVAELRPTMSATVRRPSPRLINEIAAEEYGDARLAFRSASAAPMCSQRLRKPQGTVDSKRLMAKLQ